MIGAYKDKLKRGEPVIVLNPDHPNPGLVEFLGKLPVDAVFLDCEQGSADVETVENMVRAARLAKLPSLIRLFSGEDWVIERYMGRGADGIVVPRLQTAAQAARCVEAVHYCYPQTAHEKSVVIQIETMSALDTLDEFLRVDGIDTYFLGPVDLAKGLGFLGDYRRPEVQYALDGAISKIRDAGKVAGILVDYGDTGRYVRLGVQFLYVHANALLTEGAKSFARLTQS